MTSGRVPTDTRPHCPVCTRALVRRKGRRPVRQDNVAATNVGVVHEEPSHEISLVSEPRLLDCIRYQQQPRILDTASGQNEGLGADDETATIGSRDLKLRNSGACLVDVDGCHVGVQPNANPTRPRELTPIDPANRVGGLNRKRFVTRFSLWMITSSGPPRPSSSVSSNGAISTTSAARR